jgi:hypothetical protein
MNDCADSSSPSHSNNNKNGGHKSTKKVVSQASKSDKPVGTDSKKEERLSEDSAEVNNDQDASTSTESSTSMAHQEQIAPFAKDEEDRTDKNAAFCAALQYALLHGSPALIGNPAIPHQLRNFSSFFGNLINRNKGGPPSSENSIGTKLNAVHPLPIPITQPNYLPFGVNFDQV